MYDLEDENDQNWRECQFKLKTGQECGKVVSGSPKVIYCPEHLQTRCICCHSQATHICTTTQIGEDKVCRAPLCDNRFCETDHNSRVHVNLNYMGGNK